MLLPCEVAVKCLLPAVRASIANKLTKEYKLKQIKTARLLGVSQAAVSLYRNKIRGKAMDLTKDKQVNSIINNVAKMLVQNRISPLDFMNEFCRVCIIIRKKGLLCDFHKALDANIQNIECQFCYSSQEMIK